MDKVATMYASIVMAACVFVVVGRTLYRDRKSAKSPKAGRGMLDAIIARRSPSLAALYQSGSVPAVRRATAVGPQITPLEVQLRSTIISADARERLVEAAMRSTGGDRAAAIQKVLSDLYAENNR